MKIVVVSTIRNESDILETFVRYHAQFVDRMIIINHRSVDSSSSILESLQREGLPIEYREETSLELQQGKFLTRSMKKAIEDYGADWVVPLDADEFIAAGRDERVRDLIEKLPQDRIVKVPWRTYVPLPSDDSGEPNILKRIQDIRPIEKTNLRKIMIPRSLAMKKNGFIAAGNHGYVRQAFRKQKDFPYVHFDDLVLAHFPVRSAAQIMTKAFVGWLACLAKPNRVPDENHHLKLLYDRFKNGDDIRPAELTSLAMGYATRVAPEKLVPLDIVHKPLVPELGHFVLRYTDSYTANPLPVIAQLAEEFAAALGALRQQQYRDNNDIPSRLRKWLHVRRNQ
jgi:glycosyl transferase family 2